MSKYFYYSYFDQKSKCCGYGIQNVDGNRFDIVCFVKKLPSAIILYTLEISKDEFIKMKEIIDNNNKIN